MIIKCLLCNKNFTTNREIGSHIRVHNITMRQYKERFNLIRKCTICASELSKRNKVGLCNKHNKKGEDNPFYGKKHTTKTLKKIKRKCKLASTNKWKEKEYRDKVILATSKPRHKGFKKEQSVRLIQWYKDNPEQKQIRSKLMAKSWKEGKVISNGYSCNKSKMQEQLLKEVEEIFGDIIPSTTIRLENGRYLFPDIFIEKIGLVIEFYGDFWHANPKIYKSKDIVRHNLTAQEIWNVDKLRIKKFNDVVYNGKYASFNIEIVWQNDFLYAKESVLNRLDKIINWEVCY